MDDINGLNQVKRTCHRHRINYTRFFVQRKNELTIFFLSKEPGAAPRWSVVMKYFGWWSPALFCCLKHFFSFEKQNIWKAGSVIKIYSAQFSPEVQVSAGHTGGGSVPAFWQNLTLHTLVWSLQTLTRDHHHHHHHHHCQAGGLTSPRSGNISSQFIKSGNIERHEKLTKNYSRILR